ncbi:MAG TPA: COX15/CtaA family protein [Candidatus Thermoplasmatota archaeon]|nr:COX15/CtaA family protein [Candidatus Thermoplasmatota archaeon]
MDARLRWVRRFGVAAVAMAFLLMVLGAWVKANGAGLACPDWPACYGQLLPPFPSQETGGLVPGHQGTAGGDPADDFTQAMVLYEWLHRAVVALILVPVAGLAIAACGDRRLTRELRALPALAVGIYVLQALLGAVTVVTGNPPWATTLHMAMAVVWFFTLTMATAHAFLKPWRAAAAPPIQAAPPKPAARRVHFVYPEQASEADEAAHG